MGKYTVTEKETYDWCEWRHDFNSLNRMGLEPVSPLKALFLGTLVHKALDLLASTELIPEGHVWRYDPDVPQERRLDACVDCGLPYTAHMNPRDLYGVHATQKLSAIIQHYKGKIGIEPPGSQLTEVNQTIVLGQTMYHNYLDFYKRPLPDEFRYIATEQSVLVDIPGTEHCECVYSTACQCSHEGGCRPYNMPVKYTHCECIGTTCSCRRLHQLEGTLDGLIQHVHTQDIFILENKTFTYHPSIHELKRNHQFMGYTWIARELRIPVKGVFYNGLWKKAYIPKDKTMRDLFMREFLDYNARDIEEWGNQTRITTLKMGDPDAELTRRVHPVGGCNGVNSCHFKRLCDARHKNVDYMRILNNEYTKRERTSIFEEEEVA